METDRKTTVNTKVWTIRTIIKTERDIRCAGRVSMSCSACGARRIAHKLDKVGGKTKPVMEKVEWLRKHIYWSFVKPISRNGRLSRGDDHKIYGVMTLTLV